MSTSNNTLRLCAACRRAAAQRTNEARRNGIVASRTFSQAAAATRSGSRTSTAAAKTNCTAHPPRASIAWRSPPRRHVSSSATAATASSTTITDASPKAPALRFYALFPQTLPDGAPPGGPFAIDVRALRREFLRLQAAAHPDFHHAASGSASATSRVQAEAASALINEAYRTLASPLLRAQYLLRELHGADLAGDESGSMTAAEPDVLMTVLDAREAVEDAQREEDLDGLRAENERRIRDAEDEIAGALAAADVDAAKRLTVRLRYWTGIRESVDNWEKGKPVVLQH